MSNLFAHPWTTSEKITLLTNIIQGAVNDVPAYLVQGILQNDWQPRWNEIALPEGRSLNACVHAFEELVRTTQPPRSFQSASVATYGQPGQQIRMGPHTNLVRPASDHDAPMPPQRVLQPRPTPRTSDSPLPPSTNGEAYTILRPFAPDQTLERRRKRGRPTKEEVEERDRRLAATGQTYEPKKRPNKKPRQSGTTGSLSDLVATTSPGPQTPFLHSEPGESVSGGRMVMQQGEEDESPIPPQHRSPQDDSGNERNVDAMQSPSDRLLARSNERTQAVSAVARDIHQSHSPTMNPEQPSMPLPEEHPSRPRSTERN